MSGTCSMHGRDEKSVLQVL